MITTTDDGFTRMELRSENGGRLYAVEETFGAFRVSTYPDGNQGYYFDVAACHEASEFFIRLADSLKSRTPIPE